jgi:hypothetical protein
VEWALLPAALDLDLTFGRTQHLTAVITIAASLPQGKIRARRVRKSLANAVLSCLY